MVCAACASKKVNKSTPGNCLINVRLLWVLLGACLETMLYFILRTGWCRLEK